MTELYLIVAPWLPFAGKVMILSLIWLSCEILRQGAPKV
jgi:hypothetical protein